MTGRLLGCHHVMTRHRVPGYRHVMTCNVLACHVIAIILTAYLRGIDRKNVETAKNTQQHQFHGTTRKKILGIIANRKQSPANIVTFS